MKKTAIAIAVALADFATMMQTAPKDNTWYTSAKPSWSQFHDIGDNRINNNGPTHEGQLGAGTFSDYQVSPHVGFEMGYDWLGRMPYKGSEQNSAFKAQDVQLTAKLDYPVADDLDVYTRPSGMAWCADAKNNTGFRDHGTGVSPVFAGDVEYAITLEIATRLEYQWANNIGDANTVDGRPDNGLPSIGVSYHFDQQEGVAPIVVAPAPASEVQTKHFTLKSDVLFNLSKTTLEPEGQQILNQMYSQLSNPDSKDGPVVVLGFTDRAGSDAYNQALSEKRAQSIVDYLISKGIPSDGIFAHGIGESNPVTGNACDNVKARAALIDYLTPDHRVEVEVRDIKDVVTQPQVQIIVL